MNCIHPLTRLVHQGFQVLWLCENFRFKSFHLAEKAGTKITLELVDKAATHLEQDRYLALLRSAPAQLQAAMAAIIDVTSQNQNGSVGTGESYDAYRAFCRRAKLGH